MPINCSTVHLAINFIGTLLCISATIVFSIFGNYYAVFWCILACVLAAANTFLQAVRYLNKLESFYTLDAVATIRDFGMLVGVIILGFFSYALFDVIYHHESIHAPIRESKIIVAVWCFIAAKYAFTLFWMGRKYVHYLSETRILLEEE